MKFLLIMISKSLKKFFGGFAIFEEDNFKLLYVLITIAV